MSAGWHDTATERPENGQMVEVPNNGGIQLRYRDGLWWLPDGSMYVYFVPAYWRPMGASK